jgi:hypothetical protein
VRGPADREQTLQGAQDILGLDPTFDLDGQTLPRILIQDHQELEPPAVSGLVRHKVITPHVVDVLGLTPQAPILRIAQPLTFSLLSRHLQALLTPQSIYPLTIDRPALGP